VNGRDPTQVVWRRCLAYATSLLLIALVLVAAGVAGDVRTSKSGCPHPVPAGRSCVQRGSTGYLMKNAGFIWFALAVLLLFLALVVVPQLRVGCSLGKAVFGIRVVRADGHPPGFVRSVVRLAAWAIDGIALLLPVGLWLAILTPGHRRLGDYLAGTYVVRRSAAGHPLAIASHRRGGIARPR
jgi:uncharacterized RDD family membrane protein YckC